MSWWSRLANVFRSSAVDRALDEEMQFHIDARVDDLVASGMTRQAAESAAARQFGNRLRVRESSREAKLLPWVESAFKTCGSLFACSANTSWSPVLPLRRSHWRWAPV